MAFQSPNYTQTPNDLFAMLPEMGEAELRVTLVMVRQTFGFHRDDFKMGIRKLADAAGLSRQGAVNGAEAAEKRGTFFRTNLDEQGEAKFRRTAHGKRDAKNQPPLKQSVAPPPKGYWKGKPMNSFFAALEKLVYLFQRHLI